MASLSAISAERMSVSFTPESLSVISRRFVHNVRELKGALHCLQNWSIAAGRQRGAAPVARRVLSELERDCIRITALGDVERAVRRGRKRVVALDAPPLSPY